MTEQLSPFQPKLHPILHLTLVIAIGITLILAAQSLDLEKISRNPFAWINSLGPWSSVTFVFIYILSTMLLIPATFLSLAGGVIFGVTLGVVYVTIAATIGALGAFFIGRYFARSWIEKKIEHNDRLKNIDAAVAKEGWKIVFLTRLSPVFPFTVLNYAFGVTQVSLKDYLGASFTGLIPGSIMYVYFGALAGNFASFNHKSFPTNSGDLMPHAFSFMATIAATIYITCFAKKILAGEAISEDEY